MIGRRVSAIWEVDDPGDYFGPVKGYTGDVAAVFFRLPIADDEAAPVEAHHLHHVASPPHEFVEHDDGSLEIRPSIGARRADGEGFYWHGYLRAGHKWEEV